MFENVNSRQEFASNRLSTSQRAEFVIDRMSCKMLKGRLCDIILNAHPLFDNNREVLWGLCMNSVSATWKSRKQASAQN
jgi:hypothetical protein